jgi:hypothetical protein
MDWTIIFWTIIFPILVLSFIYLCYIVVNAIVAISRIAKELESINGTLVSISNQLYISQYAQQDIKDINSKLQGINEKLKHIDYVLVRGVTEYLDKLE